MRGGGKPVIVEDCDGRRQTFRSVAAAADFLGMDSQTLARRIVMRNVCADGIKCWHADSPNPSPI